jgi:pyruvyltransferase
MEAFMTYKLYWWGSVPNDGPRVNFGDILSPYIFDYFGIPYVEAKNHNESNIICIGSIARLAKENEIAVGSGIIRRTETVHPQSIWKSCRGPLTRDRILASNNTCPPIYGDPALLLPLFCKESKKEHKIGIIPHYQHYKHIVKEYKNKHHVIDICNPNPLVVAKEITKCEKIISTSLHGIICAHAYGIPAAWVDCTKRKLHGDNVKFYDHYRSVGLEAKLSTIENPKYTVPIKYNINNLVEVFRSLQ